MNSFTQNTNAKDIVLMTAEDAALMSNATLTLATELDKLFKMDGIVDIAIDDLVLWAKTFESAQILSAFEDHNGAKIVHFMIQRKIIEFINSQQALEKQPLKEEKKEVKRKNICINPGPNSTEVQKIKYHICRLDSIIYHLIELQQAVALIDTEIARDIRDIARTARITRVDLLELTEDLKDKNDGPSTD